VHTYYDDSILLAVHKRLAVLHFCAHFTTGSRPKSATRAEPRAQERSQGPQGQWPGPASSIAILRPDRSTFFVYNALFIASIGAPRTSLKAMVIMNSSLISRVLYRFGCTTSWSVTTARYSPRQRIAADLLSRDKRSSLTWRSRRSSQTYLSRRNRSFGE
jgi:hypothetical protein